MFLNSQVPAQQYATVDESLIGLQQEQMPYPENSNLNIPKYWNHLDETDQRMYDSMKVMLMTLKRNSRHHSIENFAEILSHVKAFVFDVEDDLVVQRRGLVCGLILINNSLAINTNQLGCLINRSKSSINASLQMLGYLPAPNVQTTLNLFFGRFNTISDLKRSDFRQWTVRITKCVGESEINDEKSSVMGESDCLFFDSELSCDFGECEENNILDEADIILSS